MSTATVSKVRVPVTQDHLDKGRPGDCSRCAVALALMDAIPDLTGVAVGEAGVTLHWPGGRATSVGLPYEVIGLVADIDARRDVAPFTFEIEVPHDSH